MPRERYRGERASEHVEDSDDLPKAVEDLVAGSTSIQFEPINSHWSQMSYPREKSFFSKFAFFLSGSLVVGGHFNCFEHRFDKLNALCDNFWEK